MSSGLRDSVPFQLHSPRYQFYCKNVCVFSFYQCFSEEMKCDLRSPSDFVVQVVQLVQVVRVARTTSLDNMHSENIWFAWSEPSNCQEKLRCHARDEQTDGRRTEGGK